MRFGVGRHAGATFDRHQPAALQGTAGENHCFVVARRASPSGQSLKPTCVLHVGCRLEPIRKRLDLRLFVAQFRRFVWVVMSAFDTPVPGSERPATLFA